MSPRSQRFVWVITVMVFCGMALWPLWSARFPPMQDYPQHLFHAHVLRAYNDPAFDYNKYYEVRLHPLYATFFLATLLFSQFASIETAGKLSLSLYPVLVALVVLRLGRRARVAHGFTPWGALFFFPLAFNQQYFFGNLNYLFSLPILILALVDFEDVMERNLAVSPIVRHSLWQLALFITHPLTFLIYVSMAVVGAIITQHRTDRFWHKLAAAMALAVILLAIAWVVNKATSSAEVGAISWLTPRITLTFFALMFNGMQWSTGLDVVALMLWGAIFVILLGSLLLDWTKQGTSSLTVKNLVFLGGAFVAMLALPYGFGSFTYLNVRISAIIYFLIALLAAQVRLREWAAGVIVTLLGVCMVQSMAKQARLSAEVYKVVPVVQRIPPNSRILPLVFDPSSPELDRATFAPHLHDHNYYHVLVGGGFNPYLLKAPLHPVHYKKGVERPAPSPYQPEEFDWSLHKADYQYFLVRAPPNDFAEYMASSCTEVLGSGKWMLFARNTASNSN